MSLWTAEEAAAATGGRAQGDWVATGVSIDTRTIRPGDLFVALTDARDGHDFVAQALANQKLVLDQITALNTTTGNRCIGVHKIDLCNTTATNSSGELRLFIERFLQVVFAKGALPPSIGCDHRSNRLIFADGD